MLSIAVALLLFGCALSCAALFAYLETTFTSLRLFEVNQLETRINAYKRLFAVWRTAPQRILITILIASNFADVVCSVLLTEVMQQLIAGQLGTIVGVLSSTLLIVFLGNIIPKSFARVRGRHIAPSALFLVNLLLTVLKPILDISVWITDYFAHKMHGSTVPHEEHGAVSEQEIAFLIDYSDQKGIIESDKSEMLQNIFDLGNTAVSAIMVPAKDIVLLEVSTSIEQAHELFLSYRYSRIPLYKETPNNIVGFIYQKDLFALLFKQTTGNLADFMRPVMFVPENTKTNALLKDFLRLKTHLAIVCNEAGSVVGMATLEDVLEEIVGEITDEKDA